MKTHHYVRYECEICGGKYDAEEAARNAGLDEDIAGMPMGMIPQEGVPLPPEQGGRPSYIR